MEVVEKPENDPEWWKCKNARGQVGLVPKNYVVVLSDGPAPGGPDAGSHSPQLGHMGPSRTGKFAGKDWYYGNVTRHQAECALNERGVEGDFLVRDSESSPSDFSVSLKAPGKNKHFKVQLVDGVYCIGQRRFPSMDQLVEHYKKAPIFTSEHGEKLYLVRPLLSEQSHQNHRTERNTGPCCSSATSPSPCSPREAMSRLCVMLLGCISLLGLLCLIGAEDAGMAAGEEETREKRSMPNWSLSASDFFAWVENLRAHAGYDRIEDLARTFWAHFPPANQLGYDTPDHEE
ncbi:hypothetical protein GJAV_G00253100 [Gymnothorax javanicus]|nr:hypothetical protein GJAV_G00253100 [Gymnothorax javanicus]